MNIWTQLFEAQEEVTSLRLQLSDHSGKLLEVERELELERVKVANLEKTAAVIFRTTRSQRGGQERTGQNCSTSA